MKFQLDYSRRQLLASLAGTAAITLCKPFMATAGDVDSRVAAIVRKSLGVDMHNHVDVAMYPDMPRPNIPLAMELKRSGLTAICMAFAVDYRPMTAPDDGHERVLAAFDVMDEQLKRNGMQRSLNLHDLLAAHAKAQPTVVQAIEGAHFLNGKLERIDELYARGLRHFGLLHDSDAAPPLGDVYTNPPRNGLTQLGADVIKRCNRLGILVDLAHADAKTTADALKVSQKPLIISHTLLESAPGNEAASTPMMRARLISKAQARAVADAGGVVGVWTNMADSVAQYAQQIRALVDVIGVDHVGFGSDSKLTPVNFSGMIYGPDGKPVGFANGLRPPNGEAAKPPASGGNSPGAVGKRPHGGVDQRTNEMWPDETTGFYFAAVNALLKAGFNADEIGKVGGGNFCRVFGDVTV